MRSPVCTGLVVLLCSLLVGGVPVQASEPDGFVALRFEWAVAEGGGTAAPRLRIVLRATADLTDATLVAEAPAGVRLRRIGLRPGTTTDDVPGARLELPLGALRAASERRFEFEVLRPEGTGRIASFTISGLTRDGRRVHEALGVPLDPGEEHGRLRHGAIEFPAAPVVGSPL